MKGWERPPPSEGWRSLWRTATGQGWGRPPHINRGRSARKGRRSAGKGWGRSPQELLLKSKVFENSTLILTDTKPLISTVKLSYLIQLFNSHSLFIVY